MSGPGPTLAWSGQKRNFSQHHRNFLSQTQACCSFRPANGTLGPIQGQLRPTTDSSEQHGAHSGLQNVTLSREAALSNLNKALSGQLTDLSGHRGDILTEGPFH